MSPLPARLFTTLWWIALTIEYNSHCPDLEQCRCSGSDHGLAIDCAGHRKVRCTIKDVPYIPNITEIAVSLNLSNCVSLNISHVEAPFRNYSSLKILVLHRTNLILTDHSTTLFTGLHKLVHLDISENDQFPMTIETPVDIFAKLTSLKVLYMHGTTETYRYRNTNNSYPEELLASLPNLEKLSIDATNITFGARFRNMTKLETLRISGDWMEHPGLSFQFCAIGNICGEMLTNLVNVRELSIIKCAVRSINESAFKDMINLKRIDFSSNTGLSIEGFAKAAQNMNKDIEEIILNNIEDPYHMQCGVKFTENMTKSVQNLSVKKLSLQKNAIKCAEGSVFENLPSTLEHLEISRNEFELGMYLFYAFQMKNLKTFHMSYNFFSDDYGLWRRNDNGYGGYGDSYKVSMETEGTVIMEEADHLSRPGRRDQSVIHDTNDNPFSTDTGNDLSGIDHVVQYNMGPMDLSHNIFFGNHRDRSYKCPRNPFYIPPGTITGFLPPKMELLDVSYSKLGLPIYQFFIDKNNSLIKLKAANSLLFCWEGPVYGVEKLKWMDLSLNECYHVSLNFFSKFPELEFLNLSRNLLYESIERSKNGELFRNNEKLKELWLSFNHLQTLPEKFLVNQELLERLILSDNELSEFNLQIKHMKRLLHVNLKNNHINDISENVRKEFISVAEAEWRSSYPEDRLTLELQGNIIECSCSTIEFIRWVSEHYIDVPGRLGIIISKCKRGLTSDVYTNITSGNDIMIIMEQLEIECESYTTIYVGAAVAFVVLLNVIVGVIVHRFRWKIQYWYYVSRSNKNLQTRKGYVPIDSEETRFKYDVYIASINDDIKFVMETLKKKIENESYRVFLQDYDIPPGQNMCSFIANGIHVSRVALFVVSNGCDSDPDWHIAIRMLQEESIKREHRMHLGLVLHLNEIKFWSDDMRLLSRPDCLDFPENRGDHAVTAFWVDFMEKLKEVHNRQANSLSTTNVA